MIYKLDKALYSKEVFLKTAYTFTETAYVHLSQDDTNWIVEWNAKEGQNISGGEFENELIAQQLREELLEQTKDIRKILLARAYASTMINEEDGEETAEAGQKETADQENGNEAEAESILKGWFEQHDHV